MNLYNIYNIYNGELQTWTVTPAEGGGHMYATPDHHTFWSAVQPATLYPTPAEAKARAQIGLQSLIQARKEQLAQAVYNLEHAEALHEKVRLLAI